MPFGKATFGSVRCRKVRQGAAFSAIPVRRIGGQKRRVAICRALCASSELLILDEPFTGLDAGTKADVIRYLQKKSAGKLTLLSTHQEEDILALDGIRITI